MRRDNNTKGTDFWIMKSDGTGQRRLTFFNEKGHRDYAGDTVVVADSSWGPDGTQFVGYQRLGEGLEQKTSPMNAVLVTLDMPKILAAEAQGR
jgi:hypothetical protein